MGTAISKSTLRTGMEPILFSCIFPIFRLIS